VCDEEVIYNTALNIPIAGITHQYTISGVVSLKNNHFTSRILKPNGAVGYHDGILTGATCGQDGELHALPERFLNTCNIGGDVSKAVGVLRHLRFCTLLLIRVPFFSPIMLFPSKYIFNK
jgi:hypothetical protein